MQHVLQLVKKKTCQNNRVSSKCLECDGYLADATVSQLRYLHSMLLKKAIISYWASCFLPPLPQYFEHVEEAEWAVEVLKTTGKPVAATLCIGPEGDLNGVSPGDCAVRLVKAGTTSLCHHA